MNTDDSITIHGLSAWFQAEPRPHHLDLRLQVGSLQLRACLLTPDSTSYTVHLYRADGTAVRENGEGWLGDMEDAIILAMAVALDVSRRPELFEQTATLSERIHDE